MEQGGRGRRRHWGNVLEEEERCVCARSGWPRGGNSTRATCRLPRAIPPLGPGPPCPARPGPSGRRPRHRSQSRRARIACSSTSRAARPRPPLPVRSGLRLRDRHDGTPLAGAAVEAEWDETGAPAGTGPHPVRSRYDRRPRARTPPHADPPGAALHVVARRRRAQRQPRANAHGHGGEAGRDVAAALGPRPARRAGRHHFGVDPRDRQRLRAPARPPDRDPRAPRGRYAAAHAGAHDRRGRRRRRARRHPADRRFCVGVDAARPHAGRPDRPRREPHASRGDPRRAHADGVVRRAPRRPRARPNGGLHATHARPDGSRDTGPAPSRLDGQRYAARRARREEVAARLHAARDGRRRRSPRSDDRAPRSSRPRA